MLKRRAFNRSLLCQIQNLKKQIHDINVSQPFKIICAINVTKCRPLSGLVKYHVVHNVYL
jgi:hypothetical protein